MIASSLSLVPKPMVRWVARRYIAGETLEDAVQVVSQLNARGAHATMDVLGEFVKDREQASQNASVATQMLDQILKRELKSGISVKLTSLGLDIDEEFCYSHLLSIVSRARDCGRFVRIDMENSPYTTRTLGLYSRLMTAGLENTGVVIQACMRRSESDIQSLSALKAKIRLCKGIYVESEDIAFRGREEIRESYKKLLALLFEQGLNVAIATHDEVLIEFAKKIISEQKIQKSQYEFQMLLGVRENLCDDLLNDGYRVRIYVPFGRDWYGYCLRRLKENPQVAGHVFRALLTG